MSKESPQKKERIHEEVRKQIFTMILAGFGVVAALAWNEAIKSFVELLPIPRGQTVIAKFLYAIILTGIIVLISRALTKIFRHES